MAQEGRTEAATPRRLQRAREEGHVAASREVAPLAGLAAVTLMIAVAGQGLGTLLLGRLESMLAASSGGNVGVTLAAALLAMACFVGPIVLGILVAAVTASLLQTGPIFNPGKLRPDLGRLSVARGLGRLFGMSALIEATKAIAKVTVFGLALYHVLTSHSLMLRTAVFWYPTQIVARTTTLFLQVSETLLAAQFAIACADIVWTRHQHARQLRMTKEEVRQDAKDADGNPRAKSRLRQIRMTRSRQRMLAAVPKATVVVTNPTHYAVALSYDSTRAGAPRVVAKGVDDVAARIRERAQACGVTLVANPPLARALYTVDLDAEIPLDHFRVVAEIIAYVWRLNGQTAK